MKNLHHPLIKNVVKNDLVMGPDKNLLFLTGANMAGKSSFLRSVGIIVCLAHAGFPVPASEAVVPFYDEISVNINVQDDMLSGYSHFYSEIVCVHNFLLRLTEGKRCFAIFDEVFSGTNLNDAIGCAGILIEKLQPYQDSLAIVSTHNVQMAGKGSDHMQYNYIESRIEHGKPVFSYRILPGMNETRLGLVLFQLMQEGESGKTGC